VSARLDEVLQQQAAEREEQQGQLQELSQQLGPTQDQVLLLQQVRAQQHDEVVNHSCLKAAPLRL
jgi:DNA-directed RNA polymerase specialized sigma24 family protein